MLGRLNDVSFVQILTFIRIICAYTEKREAQTSYRKTTFQLFYFKQQIIQNI
jgi:hypothetical protein